MSRKAEALKKALVALGFGTAVSDYTGLSVVDVLKELAVITECAPSVDAINATGFVGVLNFIADNKGSEEKEPYDLAVTATNVTVVVKRGNKTISPASDILYNGDKLTITATGAEGYDVTTLTLNGEAIESGDKYTVNGHNITIVASGTLQTFDLARTVDDNVTVAVAKGGASVEDGEGVLDYGDEITITATAGEGYELDTLTVNGKAFTSGESLEVADDVAIVATSKEAAGE